MFKIKRAQTIGWALIVFLEMSVSVFAQSDAGVSVREDETSFFMSNGTLSVQVSKQSGDLVSMKYNGRETLFAPPGGHAYGYWSHDVKKAQSIETKITIDPSSNGGERAEVSVKGISGGRPMGSGPGAPPEGDVPVDIDIRYSLANGDAGVYAYCIFEHLPGYPAGDFTEARFAAKLDPDVYSHVHIDEYRSGRYPLVSEGADKYIYTTVQFDHRAYGVTSPETDLGWWILVPSPEYLTGGPNQPEFLVHGHLVAFVYWRSSHYGHGNVTLAAGESWKKVVGPFLLYANDGESFESMWDDAKARLKQEEAAWPYAWVEGGDYAHAEERTTVRGRILLNDPQGGEPGTLPGRLTVGLSKTPYTVALDGVEQQIDWQHDAKYYQHWVHSNQRDGQFEIPNVPAGAYSLHAFADGVLGEVFKADVVVPRGGQVDLGNIEWAPVRHGRTVWELGKADRDGMEFAGVDEFWHPGAPLRYRDLFPGEITFTIGESDPSKEWFYAHMPYVYDPDAQIRPFFGVSGKTTSAIRHIVFDLDETPSGTATLRVALTGTGSDPLLQLSVNGEEAGVIRFGTNDGALGRHQIRGDWREQVGLFPAALLKKGRNTLSLTVPAGNPNAGVIYDYLRLELDDVSEVLNPSVPE